MPSPSDPRTPEETDRWANRRRAHEREPVPERGERVLFREADFGETVPAVVHEVQDLSSPHDHWMRHGGLERERGPGEPDPNVWDWDEENRQYRLKADPWPWVSVRLARGTDEDGNEILAAPRWCREARVRGSAGWMREGSRAHTGNYGNGG